MSAREELVQMVENLTKGIAEREENILKETQQNESDKHVVIVLKNAIEAIDEDLKEHIQAHEKELFKVTDECKAALSTLAVDVKNGTATFEGVESLYEDIFSEPMPEPMGLIEVDEINPHSDPGDDDQETERLPEAASG